MDKSYKKVNRALNELSIWLMQNERREIPRALKTRASELLQILIGERKLDDVKPGFKRCHSCGTQVKEKNLEKHQKKCPALLPLNSHTVSRHGKNDDPKQTAPKQITTKPDNYFVERRLDGSRDYYNNFREHGRFGSHSMHDDMNDESAP